MQQIGSVLSKISSLGFLFIFFNFFYILELAA